MPSSTSGGAAGAGGFNFQHAVTAWAAVRILAGQGAPPAWELAADTTFDWLRCETEQPVDDLLVGTNRGVAFCNIKRSLTIGTSADSEFASVLQQFVRQFLSFRDRNPGARPWERPLDPALDRLVLVCSASASGTVRTSFSNVAARVRGLVAGQSIETAAANYDETTALKTALAHVVTAWRSLVGSEPANSDLFDFFRLLHVQTLELETGQSAELEAKALLRSSVLLRAEASDHAWDHLLAVGARLAQTRTGTDRSQLQRSLQDAAIELKATPTYVPDIDKLRSYSRRTLQQLQQLSHIQLAGHDVKIARASTAAMAGAVESGSFVVVGQPGAGKSGAIHDLAAQLMDAGRDVVLLAVDHLEAASPGGLRQELGLAHDLSEILSNWPGNRPGVLILDALDAARGEPATQTMRTLIAAVLATLPRWRVVVSIRKFDLRYSEATQRLFRGAPPTTFADAEFSDVRHVNIPVLAPEELEQLRVSAEGLYQVLGAIPISIRNVLFNVRLMADLLEAGVDAAQLRPIQSQLELFEKYWFYRVIKDDGHEDDRELLLRAACERMVETRTLHVERASVLAPGAGEFLRTLLSDQVLNEWQPRPDSAPDRYVLTFSHHVLFDYAVSRLLFRRTAPNVSDQLRADRDLVLVVRPSLVLHFHYCWSIDPSDRARFWNLARAISRTAAIPEVGKLIGPSAAADLAREPRDVELLARTIENNNPSVRLEGAHVLQHLVGALVIRHKDRRPLVGPEAGPWCELAERISRTLGTDTAPTLRILLTTITELSERLTLTQLRLSGLGSRRLLEFAWSAQQRDSWLVIFAIQCVCRTFLSDADASFQLLSKGLEPEHVKQFGYDELSWLAREARHLLNVSPELILRLYQAAFSYEESSKDTTDLGSGRVLTLTSTRRQDYEMALYELADQFPKFLACDPQRATRALLTAIHRYAVIRRRAGRANIEFFDFGGTQARYRPDHSYIWDASSAYKHDEPLRLLEAFENHLKTMSASDQANVLEAILGIVIDQNELAVVWKRLLRVGAERPATWGRLLVPLASAVPVLTGADTSYAAGEFLRRVFPLLDVPQREQIEHALFALPPEAGDDPHADRDRLLACLTSNDLVTEFARVRRAELEAAGSPPNNEEPVRFRFESRPFGEEEYLAEQGVPIQEEPNRRIRSLEGPVKSFAAQHRNSPPSLSESSDALPAFSELLAAIRDADKSGVHERQRDHALASLVEACSVVAAGDGLTDGSPVGDFCMALLLEASEHPDPAHNPDSDASFDESPSWGSPAIRIDAAEGLIRLARHRDFATPAVFDALTRLAQDAVPAVRFQISRYLNATYETAPEWMWTQAERFAAAETSTGVLSGFASGPLDRLAGRHPDEVSRLARVILDRFTEGPGVDSLREACTTLLILLYVWRGAERAKEIVLRMTDEPARYGGDVLHALHPLRRPLTYGAVLPINPEAEQIRSRAIDFLLRATRNAVTQFEKIQDANSTKATGTWAPADAELAKSLAQLIDGVGSTLYFASGAFRDGSNGEEKPTRDQEVRLFREAIPVLELLSSVGIPRLAHHLVETCEHFIEADPKRVFFLIGQTIVGGRRGGYQYDSLAVDLMVKVVERYLAEYRYLFREDAEARDLLLTILDIFVTAGWPSARQLSYGLEEIFR